MKERFSPCVESFMTVLKVIKNIVLYVGSNDRHVREKGKELFHKERLTKTFGVKHTVKQLKG